METKNKIGTDVKDAQPKRNLSLPLEFIEEMIDDRMLFEIFKQLVKEEPNLKAGMLIALAKRERRGNI